jgi:carbamoyl-phosphate synthase small subunit
LTRILRDKGAQNGCILAGENITEEEAIAKARAFGGLNGLDLAKECCDPEGFEWTEGSWTLGQGFTNLNLNFMLLHTIMVSKPTSYVCLQTAVVN